MPSAQQSRPVSPSPSQLPPVPSSPVYSIASTANPMSQFNLPLPPPPRPAHAVLTKADLDRSQEAYASLVASAKAYRQALATLSTAASAFGTALESCARLKEARAEPIGAGAGAAAGGASMTASYTANKGACTADTLMAASGLHHLIANHQQILSETVYRSFEVPLLHDLDKWQSVIDDEDETYQQQIKAQAREVRRLEKDGLKLHRQKRRDVARFRAHLVELTSKLDGMSTLHADHARTMLRESQDTSARIVDASCSLVRAEVDIFESLAKKGWTGGGLEDLLEKGQDLFATDTDTGNHHHHNNYHAGVGGGVLGGGTGDGGVKLHRLGLVAPGGHARSDSLLSDPERYQSLTALATSDGRAADAEAPAAPTDFNKPRNARPFSPQPIRRVPMEITEDSLGAFGNGTSNQVQQQKREAGEGSPHEDGESADATKDEREEEEEEENESDDRGRQSRSATPEPKDDTEILSYDGSPGGGWGS
ncbi:Protein IVY1 [Beauveria bassiana]|nr:Protein IVY1 [Beauveria bassiana]